MIDYSQLKQAMVSAGFTMSSGDGWTAEDQQKYTQYTYHHTNVPRIPSLYGLQYTGILPEGFPGTGDDPEPGELVSIAVTSEQSSLPAGLSVQMAATGTYSDESTEDITSEVTWSSSDDEVATVDASGAVTAVAEGSVTITATLESVVGDTSLEITAAIIESITIIGDDTVEVEDSVQLTAISVYSDGSGGDITAEAVWSSSDEDVATVSEGTVLGITVGPATITASYEGAEQTVELTVTAAG